MAGDIGVSVFPPSLRFGATSRCFGRMADPKGFGVDGRMAVPKGFGVHGKDGTEGQKDGGQKTFLAAIGFCGLL